VKKALILTCLLIAIGVGVLLGWWILGRNPAYNTQLQTRFDSARELLGLRTPEENAGVTASGFVEADEAEVSAELGGRIANIFADEGDSVKEGQILVRLDDSLLVSQIQIAQADLVLAQAALDELKAGVRLEALDRAREEVTQARAAQDAAFVTWQDSQALLEDPQDLELALLEVRGQLGVLAYQEQQAQALANAGEAARVLANESLQVLQSFEPRDKWVRVGQYDMGQVPPEIPLPPDLLDGEYYLGGYKVVVLEGTITVYVLVTVEVPADLMERAEQEQVTATYRSWTTWTGLSEAEAARRGVESLLAELTRQEAQPVTLQAQVDAAESGYRVAVAAVVQADSQVKGLEMGATPEQVQAAEAQVEIARAALQVLEVRRDKFVLKALMSGLVLDRALYAGEVALPGAPILTLADLDHLTLTVYVPEDEVGKIEVGDPVSVSVDSYPDRVFAGIIRSIGSEAEYTPRNVQTHEERVSMVFAVSISLANDDGALKPGMPADVQLVPSLGSTDASPALVSVQRSESAPTPAGLSLTGIMEGEEIAIVSEAAGAVARVMVGEGDRVEADQVVIELDARSLTAQLAEAKAVEAGAEANLLQVKAGVHPAEILAARAALGKALAERDAAENAWLGAQAILQDPQDLEAGLVRAKAAVDVASAQIEQAESQVAGAEAERDRYRAQGTLQEKGLYVVYGYQVEAALLALNTAEASRQGAQEKFAALQAIRDNPLVILSQLHAAEGRYKVANAGAEVAKARLGELEAGPTGEEVHLAEAQVGRAHASVMALQQQMEKSVLRSPIAGMVTAQLVHTGETALAGAVLLKIANLDDLRLVVYVPADELGQVYVGQGVEVRVDSFPEVVFSGSVARISEQAEFTPNNVQTGQDRSSMVFAVKVRVHNPGHLLKPGMPADAVFAGR
jgi:HlyD family secretion protein